MFTDRHQVGQDVLTREQIIEQISEGDPHRRKMAEQLLRAIPPPPDRVRRLYPVP